MKKLKLFSIPVVLFFLGIITMGAICNSEDISILVIETETVNPTTPVGEGGAGEIVVAPGEILRIKYLTKKYDPNLEPATITSIRVGLTDNETDPDNMNVIYTENKHNGESVVDDTLTFTMPSELNSKYLVIQVMQTEPAEWELATQSINLNIVDKIWSTPTISATPTETSLTATPGQELSFDITVAKNALQGQEDNFISGIGTWSSIDNGANWVNGTVNIQNLFLNEITKTVKYTVPASYTSGTVIDLRLRADFNYPDANNNTFTEIVKTVTVQ